MSSVNIHEAKTHFSRLVARVEEGEEITIAKAGRPVAKLVGIRGHAARRPLGTAQGKVIIADDFDAPLPSHLKKAFGG